MLIVWDSMLFNIGFCLGLMGLMEFDIGFYRDLMGLIVFNMGFYGDLGRTSVKKYMPYGSSSF